MTKVLILGANGQLARNTTRVLLRDTDAQLWPRRRRWKSGAAWALVASEGAHRAGGIAKVLGRLESRVGGV